ncbi:3'(2'),5'-bisphosphate nucleotidase CysQ [Vibrio stylophorae]|uniref:3'(2'),5'-bisphosphate nucleotidase CysQ n=1 Tax=Vibrio stylophorae TaxID=659351 RepID=A0ABN8DRB8_9VIBR|nr:3'(2'),5'-bisphosphate nucleotidase CysQ [Vibrio stylophorae]CAH0532348.1 3'(2'),5'-bisphosphate nucleotidase CysQ [Vibrio stylophorae]
MDHWMLLEAARRIARQCGETVTQIYQQGDFEQHLKDDQTPVTSADMAAHALLTQALSSLTPHIPVMSEEGKFLPLAERQAWPSYWLVDPIDGTQEFINRSDQFAVVIALIENNEPTLGVVHAPILGRTYYALKGQGAWCQLGDETAGQLQSKRYRTPPRELNLAVSHRQNVDAITEQLSPAYHYEWLRFGSAALKTCLIAEGAADAYWRSGPTGEWDTAAGQVILTEAGGQVMTLNLEPLSYNQRETLINPDFIVVGDGQLPWAEILQR